MGIASRKVLTLMLAVGINIAPCVIGCTDTVARTYNNLMAKSPHIKIRVAKIHPDIFTSLKTLYSHPKTV